MMKKSLTSISRRLSFFKRLVLTSLIPSLCAIVMLFLGFYPFSLAVADKNDSANEQTRSERIAEELRRLELAGADAADAVEKSEWLHPLYFDHCLHSSDVSAQTIRDISSDLRTLVLKEERLLSVSFQFYGQENELFSSEGIYFDLALHRAMTDDLKFRFFPASENRKGLFTVFPADEPVLIYCTPVRDIPEGRAKADVNAVLSTGRLASLLEQEGILRLNLYDADGTQVLRIGDENASGADVSGALRPGAYTYVYTVPRSLHSRNRRLVTAIMLPAILVVTAVAVLLSYLFSNENLRPVSTVVQALRGTAKVDPKRISAASLEDLVDTMLARKQETERKIERFRPLAQQNLLGGILSGEAFLRSSGRRAEEFDLTFAGNRFAVLALEYDDQEIGLMPEEPVSLPVYALDGVGTAMAEKRMFVYVYRDYSGRRLILVNYYEPEQLEAFTAELKNGLEARSGRQMGRNGLRCGVGSEVGTLEEVYRSSEQASTALSYAVLNQIPEFVHWNEIADLISSGYSYTFSDEMLLSSAVIAGDRESSMEIVRRIVNQNIQAAEADPRVLRRLYYDIRSTVSRSRQKKGLQMEAQDQTSGAPKDFRELIDRIDNQIGEICSMIAASCSYAASRKDAEIFDYIDRNLFNYELSLTSTAERFGVSDTYVSKLFKNQRAINYNDYVNGKRIEKAVEILSKEHPPISTVYRRVGYISDSTFRRNFIKYTRKNPSDLS